MQYLADFLVGCVAIGIAGSLVNCGGSSPEMEHEAATAMLTAIPAVDSVAAAVTATAGVALETIEAALANQPTVANGVVAEPTATVTPIGAEATLQAAVDATLTALAPTSTLLPSPTATPTPNLDATKTASAEWMVTAVSATLTAHTQLAATQAASSPAPPPSSTELLAPASLERIHFASGSTAYTFSTQLTPGLAKGYVLRTLTGQYLFVMHNNLIRSAVLDPDNFELPPSLASNGQLVFQLAKPGDYTLVVAGDGQVTITIDVPPLPEKIQFTPGSTSATFTLSLTQHVSHAYTLWVVAGQQFFFTVTQPIALVAFAPDGGELISNLPNPSQWQFAATQTGDQRIFLQGAGDVTVTIIIPPL